MNSLWNVTWNVINRTGWVREGGEGRGGEGRGGEGRRGGGEEGEREEGGLLFGREQTVTMHQCSCHVEAVRYRFVPSCAEIRDLKRLDALHLRTCCGKLYSKIRASSAAIALCRRSRQVP